MAAFFVPGDDSRDDQEATVRFWLFAAKSDIRPAEDRTKWRDISPLADRSDSPV